MKTIIIVLQIIFSLILIVSILLQTKGTGLGSTFGQSGEAFRTKRGMEKIMHYLTIASAVIFFLLSFLNLLLK